MKELVLNYEQWRCGNRGSEALGVAGTRLYNGSDLHGRCCLGIFAPQINPNITDIMLLGVGNPEDLNIIISDLSQLVEIEDKDGKISDGLVDTKLSIEAIKINDNEKTTPAEKIALLRGLFGKYDYKIKVINGPEGISPE